MFGGTEGLWATVGGNLFPVGTAVGEEKDMQGKEAQCKKGNLWYHVSIYINVYTEKY